MYRAEYVPKGVRGSGLLFVIFLLENKDGDDFDVGPFSVEAAVAGEGNECSSEPDEDDEESGAVVACNFTPVLLLPMHDSVGYATMAETVGRNC